MRLNPFWRLGKNHGSVSLPLLRERNRWLILFAGHLSTESLCLDAFLGDQGEPLLSWLLLFLLVQGRADTSSRTGVQFVPNPAESPLPKKYSRLRNLVFLHSDQFILLRVRVLMPLENS